MTFKAGDKILITCKGRILMGRIEVISDTQRAAMIAYPGILAGRANRMPVLKGDDGVWREAISDSVELTIRPEVISD
jgi:hypothetical protein